MNPASLVRWTALSAAIAAAPLTSCGRPSFEVRSPPSLTARIPAPPALPESVSQESATGGGANARRVTAARPLGNVREQTVLMVIDGESTHRAALLEMLPPALVAARFTRVLLPPGLDGVTGTVERTGGGERTALSGSALQLLPMRANTPVDAVLRVELRNAADVIERTTRFEVPPEALQRYATALAQYREGIQRTQRELMAASSYPTEVESAVTNYQRRGGNFADAEDRTRLEEAQAFIARYAQLDQQLRAALAATPPDPEAVQRAVRNRTTTERSGTPAMRLRAVFSDLRAGETFWVDDIRISAPTEAEALAQAVTTLINDLGGGG